MSHTHDDDRLTIGCPTCATNVAADQYAALLAASPLRNVTWYCTYNTPSDDGWDDDDTHILSFTRQVRVPHGWHEWQVDDEYMDRTGAAFVDALPDSVPPNMTEYACTTMNVERVAIGSVIPEPDRPLDAVDPSLFDVTA